jgi:hypothetical protein
MFSSLATRFLKASLQRTQAALQHTMYDVTETLAEIQGKTEVRQALESIREQKHDRHQSNLWLTAYQNRGFIGEDLQTLREITLGVMDCVKTGAEKAAETGKILQEKLKAAVEQSKLAQDIKQTILYTIEQDLGLGLLGHGLATQKEALLDSIRNVLEGEEDIQTIRYLLDEVENLDEQGNINVLRPCPVLLSRKGSSRPWTMWCSVRKRIVACWLGGVTMPFMTG